MFRPKAARHCTSSFPSVETRVSKPGPTGLWQEQLTLVRHEEAHDQSKKHTDINGSDRKRPSSDLDNFVDQRFVEVARNEASTNALDFVRTWFPSRDDWALGRLHCHNLSNTCLSG